MFAKSLFAHIINSIHKIYPVSSYSQHIGALPMSLDISEIKMTMGWSMKLNDDDDDGTSIYLEP